jgi:integrase
MLTDLEIKRLPLPEKRREISDGKIAGLYLIVQASGAKSWALRYRIDGAPKKFTIGPYPAIDLATARKRAQEAAGEVAGGKDPAAIKQASRTAAKAERVAQVDLVERVVELFVERHAKPKTRDWRETARMLAKDVVSRWSGRRLSQITRAHVHEMLDEIVDRGAPIHANRVFAQLRAMSRWAVSRGIIERSPCEGMTAPSPEARRERVLDDHELRLVWKAFESIGAPFGPIGKLLFLTGARRSEIAGATWREIDLAAKTLTLPGSRTKNGQPHEIFLSDAAVEIIKELPRVEGKAGFVFTSTGATAVSGFSKSKQLIERTILAELRKAAIERGEDPGKVEALKPWTLHDARRTVATNLQKLGVRLEVTEAVLGHVSGSRAGIVGVYQKYQFGPEARAALDAWARRLEEIVNGTAPSSNVVPLAAARA